MVLLIFFHHFRLSCVRNLFSVMNMNNAARNTKDMGACLPKQKAQELNYKTNLIKRNFDIHDVC